MKTVLLVEYFRFCVNELKFEIATLKFVKKLNSCVIQLVCSAVLLD